MCPNCNENWYPPVEVILVWIDTGVGPCKDLREGEVAVVGGEVDHLGEILDEYENKYSCPYNDHCCA